MELVKSFTEHDGKFYVSTKQIAERFGKQHKDVLRKYSAIVKQLEELQLTDIIRRSFAPSNFNRLHDGYSELQEVMCSRDGFSVLVMSFTGKQSLKWKFAFIDAFNALEKKVSESIAKIPKKSKTQMIDVPVYDINLFGEYDIVTYHKVPKEEVSNVIKLHSYARHCNKIAMGCLKKVDVTQKKIETINQFNSDTVLKLKM